MGLFLKEHDIYIGGLLENLNLRFAPSQGVDDGLGGVEEMAALQQTFRVFSDGRSFKDCVALLGLASHANWKTKNRWFQLLDWLDKCPSDTAMKGGERIVSVLEQHLEPPQPSPVHFTAHDLKTDKRVLVRPDDQPIFYMTTRFLTISLPMQAREK